MTATLIVPDVHGNLGMAAGLLRQAGALDEDGNRINQAELRTVQLGDLCNCTSRSLLDDYRCLDRAEEWFDHYLAGNHEHPYFGGPAFYGFYRDAALGRRLRGLQERGRLAAAFAVDDILVTHAGLGVEWDLLGDSAEEAASWLNETWRIEPGRAGVFRKIGRARGGSHETGGILWADWSEPKSSSLRQIVGHSVGGEVRHVEFPETDRWAICLDLGGGKSGDRLAGALVRDGDVEIVVYDRLLEATIR